MLQQVEEETITLAFSVRDTGPGIALDQRMNLFHAFTQLDSSMQRLHGGSGLGLAISRQLVQLMGGTIYVEEAPDHGAVFRFTLTLSQVDSLTVKRKERTLNVPGMHVLAVDDNQTSREIIMDYLKAWGCIAAMASNASDAMNLLQQAEQVSMPFSVVVIDRYMPGIDGLELANLIQRSPLKTIPRLIMMSGFSIPLAQEITHFGFASAVAKPIRASDLYDAMVFVSNNKEHRTPKNEPVKPQEISNTADVLRILLAEDNYINQEVAKEMITTLGHYCDAVSSGVAVLAQLKLNTYHIVLMDCQMPLMDGFEATRQIRAWESNSKAGTHIPVIALTAQAMQGDRELCLSAGMDDYMSKPLMMDGLSAMLQKWAPQKEESKEVQLTPTLAFPEKTIAETAITRDSSSDEPDAQAVVNQCSGNAVLATRMMNHFMVQAEEDLTGIEKQIAAKNCEEMVHSAHRLKGSAGNLALGKIHKAAAAIVAQGRAGTVADTEDDVAIIANELERLKNRTWLVD